MRGHSFRAVLASVVLVGCSDEPSVRFDVGNDDTLFAGSEVTYGPEDQFATLSRDGVVKLGLTRERVYFTISDAVREHVDTEIEKGMEESDSRLGRAISGAVRSGVRSALRFDVDFRVDDIRDVEYRGDELVFEWEDPDDDRSLQNIEVSDEPVTRAFDDESARAFVDAFRRVKRGETIREAAPAPAPATRAAADSLPAADTSGGASF